MYIERDGIKIHLTQDEVYQAYKEQQYKFYVDDAKSWLNDNGYEVEDDVAECMAEYVEDNNDCTDGYWSIFEDAYESVKE